MYSHWSPSAAGSGGAAGRASSLLYVEAAQGLTQLVRDTNYCKVEMDSYTLQ